MSEEIQDELDTEAQNQEWQNPNRNSQIPEDSQNPADSQNRMNPEYQKRFLIFAGMATEIYDAISEIEKQTEGMSYREFMKKPMLHEILLSYFGSIQDVAKNLPEDMLPDFPKVDWEELKTIKDIVLHPVLGLNPESLWDMIRIDLPFQKKCLLPIVESCSHGATGGICECCSP